MKLEYLNENYPCSQRIGYAKKCNCKNKDSPIDMNYIQCAVYGKISPINCKDCTYQIKEVANNS